MDNQHKLIKGYRDLTECEIDLMNKVKEKAEDIRKLLSEIEANHADTAQHSIDMRWLNIGKTDLQKGFMAVIRAIAKPDSF